MHKNKFNLVQKALLATMFLVCGWFYFCNTSYAVNFHDLIATKNILQRGSDDLWRQGNFDGDGAWLTTDQYYLDVLPKWPFLDNNLNNGNSLVNQADKDAVATYAKVMKTPVLTTDENIPVIPRKYNDLSFMIPKNYNKYYPAEGEEARYTNLENLICPPKNSINNIYVWPGRYVNGFIIKDHSKPASFVVKKVTYANGNWIDLLYTVKLSGDGRNNWSGYKNTTGNFRASYDVGIGLGAQNSPDPSDWLKVSTDAAGVRNGSQTSPQASSKWDINIKFLYDTDVQGCKGDNDKVSQLEPVKLNGTYQAFNVNQRKGFAFDKNDLTPINRNGTILPRLWAFNDQSNGNTKVKGHLDSNGRSFDLMGTDTDNSGTRNDLAFMYLFDNGQVNWVNYSTANVPTAMYVNTSNRPVTRAELPFLNVEGTTTKQDNKGQSKIFDSSGGVVTAGRQELFTNATAQFQLLQKFPVQPTGFAPTVFKVKNFTVPKYATISLPKDATTAPYTIAINSLNAKDIDQLINNTGSQNPQTLKEQPADATSAQHAYDYELNTTKLLGPQFDGFVDLFIRADLNFQIDWGAKQTPTSANSPYQWEKDVVTHDGVKCVKVKASGISSNIYRGDPKDSTVENFGTKTPQDTTSPGLEQISYVQVPEKTYQFAYKDKDSKTITPKDSTLTQPLQQTISSSQTADASIHAPNHLLDAADKDYLYDHATITTLDSNGTPVGAEKAITATELAALPLKYDQDHKYKITLYYNGTISRATFHYWDASINKTNPAAYVGISAASLPDELFTLAGDNYTLGSIDQPLQENLPARTKLVDASLSNTDSPIPNAPAPSLMASGHKYLGYYLMVNGTSTFHPYDPNADASHNNAQVIGNYQKTNQVIVFVYASKYGTALTPDKSLAFNSQYSFNLQTTNKSEFQLKIEDDFLYQDQQLQWPTRHWKVTAQITNFKTASHKALPQGTTVSFAKPNLTKYTGLGNGDTITAALNRASLTTIDTQGDTDNVELLNVANLKDQPNSSATVTTKSESAILSWKPDQISLKIPDANNVVGQYTGTMTWTLSNTP